MPSNYNWFDTALIFFRLNDDDVGSRIGSRQSLSPSMAETNNVVVVDSDIKIVDPFNRRRVSDSVSEQKATLLSTAASRRNTVTYDMTPAQNHSELTNLVQQLIPSDHQVSQEHDERLPSDAASDQNHFQDAMRTSRRMFKRDRHSRHGSARRRASSAFSRLVHRDNGRLSVTTVTSSGPSAREKKKELRLARISLCIVWLFIFCHVWKLIPTFYTTFISEDNNVGFDVVWPDWLNIIDRISHTFITLNSSLNFLIYVVV